MRNNLKKIFAVIVSLALILSTAPITFAAEAASGTCGDNLTWTLDNSGVLTISGTGDMKNYGGNVGSLAPWDSSSITSVVIENGVTSIGDEAFGSCESLTSVSIPDSVTSIGWGAFSGCEGLTSVSIPNSVTSIGFWAFEWCVGLRSVKIPNSVKSIGDEVFLKCENLIYIYYNGSEEDWNSILVPDPLDADRISLMAEVGDGLTDATIYFNAPMFANTISVYVNGAALSFDQAPVIIDGRTLVPLRAIFEALGAVVDWNNDTQTVTASKGGSVISLTIGSNELLVNGTLKELDVPASLINGRTMIPARAVAEAFGCTVEWDNDTRSVIIK